MYRITVLLKRQRDRRVYTNSGAMKLWFHSTGAMTVIHAALATRLRRGVWPSTQALHMRVGCTHLFTGGCLNKSVQTSLRKIHISRWFQFLDSILEANSTRYFNIFKIYRWNRRKMSCGETGRVWIAPGTMYVFCTVLPILPSQWCFLTKLYFCKRDVIHGNR